MCEVARAEGGLREVDGRCVDPIECAAFVLGVGRVACSGFIVHGCGGLPVVPDACGLGGDS